MRRCACGCGKTIPSSIHARRYFSPACRMRAKRARDAVDLLDLIETTLVESGFADSGNDVNHLLGILDKAGLKITSK